MTSLILSALILHGGRATAIPFTRSSETKEGVITLETSAHRLTAQGKPDVWIVGVTHVGSKDYYSKIQTLLDAQEAVLFEGVKDDTKPNPTKAELDKSHSNSIYKVISDALELDFQLIDINYDRKGWTNSDVSWQQMSDLQTKHPNADTDDTGMLKMLFDPNTAKMFASFMQTATPGTKAALKIFMVQNLAKPEIVAQALGAGTADLIVNERNKAAEQVFDKTIAAPVAPKTVAIFYGAGHGAGLAKDLWAKYGYQDVEQRWYTVATGDKRKLDDTGRMLLAQMQTMFATKKKSKS